MALMAMAITAIGDRNAKACLYRRHFAAQLTFGVAIQMHTDAMINRRLLAPVMLQTLFRVRQCSNLIAAVL